MKLSNKYHLLFLLMGMVSFAANAQIIRMETVLGNIDIELHPDVAPNTVANFLEYVNGDDYDDSFIHRSVPNFIIQGGSIKFVGENAVQIPARGQLNNEYSLPNVRGTIAMAKLNNQPDSAKSGWFINTIDNSTTLGPSQNGGFTVFGTVINGGMDVVDAISAVPRNSSTVNPPTPIVVNVDGENFNFFDLPYLRSFPNPFEREDAVIVSDIFVLDGAFKINSGLAGAWFNSETSGSGILFEVLPTLDKVFMAWFTHDAQSPVEGTANTVGSPGQRWLTGIGDINHENNSVTFDLVSTSNGLFDNPQDVVNSAPTTYGSMTIIFQDCSNASVEYNLIAQELSGSFTMGRISADNIALCQSLSLSATK
jgi:cyclophilin family peptidyl-prolyl cis-trans isomerase